MANKTAQEIEAIASAVEVGDVLPWQSITGADPSVRVMAVAEGYAMVRRKGAVPFVLSLREWASKSPSREDSHE